MKAPTQCIFWKSPESAFATRNPFELLKTYVDDDHWRRCLLKCRECGQLYFYEFQEEIDWADGNDPQYRVYIPVETNEEIEALERTPPLGLLNFFPRLHRDWPKDTEQPTVRWVLVGG